MDNASQPCPTNGSEPKGADSCGVIYIATEAPFVEAAIASAQSVRTNAGIASLKVHIWTNLECRCRDAGLFDSVEGLANPHRRSKVDCLSRTPFQRTLYLDADTRVIGSLVDLFRVLDRFDIAMAHAHKRANANSRRKWQLELPAAFSQFNGGVILYRRTDKVLTFLEAWREAFHTAGCRKDQVTLRELVWASDLQVYVLPPEFNVRYKKVVETWDEEEAVPTILHMRDFVSRGVPK